MCDCAMKLEVMSDFYDQNRQRKISFVSGYVVSTYFCKSLAEEIFIMEYLQTLTKKLHQSE